MKYKVINVVDGQTVIGSESKAEIKSWFSQRRRLEDLNVTGKDVKPAYTGWSFAKGFFYEKYPMRIRRYQVIDDKGRSVDPRLWETESVEEPVCRQLAQMVPITGCKRHRGRGKGVTLVRQAMREASGDLELEVKPIRSDTKIRTNKYNNPKPFCSEDLKCWKNAKVSRQWARHKKGNFQPAKLADMFLSVEEDIFYQGFLDDCLDDSPERIFA